MKSNRRVPLCTPVNSQRISASETAKSHCSAMLLKGCCFAMPLACFIHTGALHNKPFIWWSSCSIPFFLRCSLWAYAVHTFLNVAAEFISACRRFCWTFRPFSSPSVTRAFRLFDCSLVKCLRAYDVRYRICEDPQLLKMLQLQPRVESNTGWTLSLWNNLVMRSKEQRPDIRAIYRVWEIKRWI